MSNRYEIKLKNGSCYAISDEQYRSISSCLLLPRNERSEFICVNDNFILRVDFIAEIYEEGRGRKEAWEI